MVEQIVGLIAHTEFRRSQCAVGKFLRLVEQAIRRHGVQNLDRAPRFLPVVLFRGHTVSKNRSPCIEAANGVIRSGSLGKECGNLIIDGEEVVILASHFLCGLKRLQKMIRNFLGSHQRPYRRIFHEPILKRIPRVRPLVRFAHEVVANALSIFVVEGGQRREKFTALRFIARRWMQPEIEKRWPQDIRDGHELEVVSRLLPNLRAILDVCS